MKNKILSEYEYSVRTDIKPSEVELPIENWRLRPDKDISKMIKSLAQVGLIHPPIIALYTTPRNNKKGVVIDGNRRTFAAQTLEKGYSTTINDIKVTLNLPDNWRFAVLDKSYEVLTNEEKDRIRYHSTEQHLHFTFGELKTRITRTAEKYFPIENWLFQQ